MSLTESQLRERIEALWKLFDPCRLCPRECRVHRRENKKGSCGAGSGYRLAAWAAHRGEEPPISGTRGSGTIFSSHCPLHCVFCQNYPFSQLGNGQDLDLDELGDVYVKLARKGVHNLNFVTPTQFVPHLFEAWVRVRSQLDGLPIVYNTSGYERLELLQLLDGMVDIYLPDIRYADNRVAKQLSTVGDYVEVDRAAILEMARQVGPVQLDNDGIARRGLIIRHLVLPGKLAGTRSSLEWIKENLGADIQLSLMCQYFPAHKAPELPGLDRRLEPEEYHEALDLVEELGFENVWAQDPFEEGGA